MSEQQTKQEGPALRGGTEGGELGRILDPGLASAEGTPGIAAPSGGVRARAVNDQTNLTGLSERIEATPERFAGGKTREAILGYLEGVAFPAKKDWIVRAARRASAPDDVVRALEMLPATEYDKAESLLRDYLPLPDKDDVEPTKGKT